MNLRIIESKFGEKALKPDNSLSRRRVSPKFAQDFLGNLPSLSAIAVALGEILG